MAVASPVAVALGVRDGLALRLGLWVTVIVLVRLAEGVTDAEGLVESVVVALRLGLAVGLEVRLAEADSVWDTVRLWVGVPVKVVVSEAVGLAEGVRV